MHGYDLWEFPPENERRKRTGEFCLPEHRKKAWSSYQLTPSLTPPPEKKTYQALVDRNRPSGLQKGSPKTFRVPDRTEQITDG